MRDSGGWSCCRWILCVCKHIVAAMVTRDKGKGMVSSNGLLQAPLDIYSYMPLWPITLYIPVTDTKHSLEAFLQTQQTFPLDGSVTDSYRKLSTINFNILCDSNFWWSKRVWNVQFVIFAFYSLRWKQSLRSGIYLCVSRRRRPVWMARTSG